MKLDIKETMKKKILIEASKLDEVRSQQKANTELLHTKWEMIKH